MNLAVDVAAENLAEQVPAFEYLSGAPGNKKAPCDDIAGGDL